MSALYLEFYLHQMCLHLADIRRLLRTQRTHDHPAPAMGATRGRQTHGRSVTAGRSLGRRGGTGRNVTVRRSHVTLKLEVTGAAVVTEWAHAQAAAIIAAGSTATRCQHCNKQKHTTLLKATTQQHRLNKYISTMRWNGFSFQYIQL